MANKTPPFKKIEKRRNIKRSPTRMFNNKEKRIWEKGLRDKPYYTGYLKRRLPELAVLNGVEEILLELGRMYDTKLFYVPRAEDPNRPALYVLAMAGLSSTEFPAIIYDNILHQWYMDFTWMEFIHDLGEDPRMKKIYKIGTLKEYR